MVSLTQINTSVVYVFEKKLNYLRGHHSMVTYSLNGLIFSYVTAILVPAFQFRLNSRWSFRVVGISAIAITDYIYRLFLKLCDAIERNYIPSECSW